MQLGSFKDWLVLEGGFADGADPYFFAKVLLPSDALDWVYAHPQPADFFLMQKRWGKDNKDGRKFININLEKVLNNSYVSVNANTMPDDKPSKINRGELYL